MLSVCQLAVDGRRDPLLPDTSLHVARSGLLLVTGDQQDHRTALALTLSGRMKPSAGRIEWDGSAGIKHLRTASAIVDSPGVNEPEQHLSVRDLVTEDLALVPRRYRDALPADSWLKENRIEGIAGLWVEQLDAGRRLGLLTALALADPGIELLVVDSPDRHSGNPAEWLAQLEELANNDSRPLAVVATVSSLPAGWDGPAASIGNARTATEGPPAPPSGRGEPFGTLMKEEAK